MGIRPLFVLTTTAVVGTLSTLAITGVGADASIASPTAPQAIEIVVDPALVTPPALPAAPVDQTTESDAPQAQVLPTPPVAPQVEPAEPVEDKTTVSVTNDAETICLAKIVHHESANQPREGQVAVAQVVMNRTKDRRFAKTLCGVATQKGQFFNVHAYNPSRDARWQKSLAIARAVREGKEAPVVGNATFFQATWADGAFFRTLKFVKRIHGHNFYALKG